MNLVAGTPKNDHTLDRCPALERFIDVLLERNDAAAPVAAIRRDDGGCAAIRNPIANAIRAEAAKDDGMNRADPRAGEHRDCRLRNGRHINDDAIAFADSVSLQDVGEAADFAMQLLVGQDAFVAWLAFPDDRGLVPAWPLQMTIEAIFRDVQLSADKPFREGRLPFEDLFPRLLPGQLAGLARPEFFRLTDRFPVHSSVVVEAANTGFFGKITRGFEDAGFLEVGLDVLFHEGNGTLTSGSGVLNEKFIARRESGERTRRTGGCGSLLSVVILSRLTDGLRHERSRL